MTQRKSYTPTSCGTDVERYDTLNQFRSYTGGNRFNTHTLVKVWIGVLRVAFFYFSIRREPNMRSDSSARP